MDRLRLQETGLQQLRCLRRFSEPFVEPRFARVFLMCAKGPPLDVARRASQLSFPQHNNWWALITPVACGPGIGDEFTKIGAFA